MKPVPVDWTDWSFGPGRHPLVGAAASGLTALSVVMVGWHAGLPAAWPVVAGLVLALAAAVSAAWQAMPGAAVLFRAGCWVAAGGWASWTLAVPEGGPWSRWPVLVLATGAGAAGLVGTGLAKLEQQETPEPDQPAASRRDSVTAAWEALLRQITRREVTVLRVERWDPPTGFTLHCQLPPDGTTVSDIDDFKAQLAFAADLPEGCNVEVLGGGGRRRSFRVRVATVNAMAEIQHLPDDTSPLSIEQPLPIGVHADRTLASVHLRYACAVLVGQTDSGKSNTLNDITHQLVRCDDALVWAIDLSGLGRFPRPWVRAWREGHADRPAIDWAAVTVDEAAAMTTAAVTIINGRTAAYERLMHQQNVDKIPVSPELPQIVILADEFGDLPEPIKAALETISNTGRGAAVRVVSSVLRATGTYVSRAMIVQARERIAMRVSDEAELQYLFDQQWGRGRVDPASVPYQGSGLISTGTNPIAPFKAWRLEPARIEAASIAVADLRPGLDRVSVELAGPAYAGRWERTLPVMFPDLSRPAAPPQQATAGGTTTTLAPPRLKEDTVDMGMEESARHMQEVAQRAREAREAAEAEQAADPEADWSVLEGWLVEAAPGRPVPDVLPRVRMRQLVQEHRRDGIGPRAVWQTLRDEGYATVEQTVIGWMRRDAEAGILAQPGGKGSAYVPGPNFRLDP